MKDFCGIRTGANNLCRRDNLTGQYGRAAVFVARTHKTRLPQANVSTKKELAFTQRHTPPVSLAAATPLKEGGFSQHNLTFYTGKRFCGAFPQKAGFFGYFFYIKKVTITHKHHSLCIRKRIYSLKPLIHYTTQFLFQGVSFANKFIYA